MVEATGDFTPISWQLHDAGTTWPMRREGRGSRFDKQLCWAAVEGDTFEARPARVERGQDVL